MPVTFEWDPKYSLHHEGLDAEHQELFSLVNEMLAIEDPEQESQRFKRGVKQLFRYMEVHFRHEEEVMEKVGYSDRTAHIAKHRQIVAFVTGMVRDSGSLAELADNLQQLLPDWLLNHVGQEGAKITASIDRSAMARSN